MPAGIDRGLYDFLGSMHLRCLLILHTPDHQSSHLVTHVHLC